MDGSVWGLGRAFYHSTAVIEEAEERQDKIPSTEVYSRRQVKVSLEKALLTREWRSVGNFW